MPTRLSAILIALIAATFFAGCGEQSADAVSTNTDTSASGDAAAPEGEPGNATEAAPTEEAAPPEEAATPPAADETPKQ